MRAKRFLAILLCILLVGSVFPAGVIAEEMVVDTEIATAVEEAAQAQEGEDIQEVTIPDTETAAESMEEEPQTPPEEIPEPPVSEAPVTEAPVTEAPVTEQVVTEPVATEAPVTEPVVTEKVETEQAAGEKAAFGDIPDTDPEESPATEKSYPAFNQSMTVDGVTVTVSAQEGTFPEGAMLSVVSVPTSQVESDIEKERDEEQNVVVSYTFDIKVLDKDGTELQPADDKPVQVSFRTAEVADPNLETNVYHVPEEGEVETLDVDVSGSTAITETDGFSLYTVEFTYNNLEYILQGDSRVPLQDILKTVGLVGEATGAQVSNAELFSVSNETGEWVVTSHKPFSSEEWLKVTIDEKDYQITVTDDNATSGSCGPNLTWSYDAGTLTITGSGDMDNYNTVNDAPWKVYNVYKDITKVELPDGLTSIGDFAFFNCVLLTSVEIPSSVTSIGIQAFGLCRNLESIVIPSGVTSVRLCAFYYCPSLTTVKIPASVKKIGESVFIGCEKLHDIYYEGTQTQWAAVEANSTRWDVGSPDNKVIHCRCSVQVSANPTAGGTVSGGGDNCYTNTEVTVKATPNEGYVFVNWTSGEEVKSDKAKYTFTADGDCTLVANFKLPLTIKAKNQTLTYTGQIQGEGDTVYKSGFESIVEVIGLQDGDELSQIVIGSQGKDVGYSEITPSGAGVVNNGKDVTDKYVITTVDGTLTIEPKDVTITTGSDSKTYDGQPLTKEEAKIEGLVNGETATVTATGSQTIKGSSENTYTIDWGTTDEKNYTVTEKLGMLTVNPAEATITVKDASKVKGEKDPAFTGKVEGLVKDSDLGKISYSRTNTDEDPGTYTGVLTAGYTSNDNYTVTVKNGDFTIKGVFTLKWVDENGSELQTKTYVEGEQPPTYDGKDPVKAATAQYSYTFSGWDSGTVSGTVTTFKPVFTETVNKYKVTFVDEDGKTVLKEAAEYDYGTAADKIEKPKDPTKAATVQYTYTFLGWDPQVADVTGDATYKATYKSTINKYKVTFVDEDGKTVLKEAAEYEYGTAADKIEKPKDPTKAADAKNTYTFSGWDPKVADVTGDATYKATYASTPIPTPTKQGTLTFDLGGGTLDGKTGKITIKANVGDTIKLPGAPTKEGYTFKFWKGSEYAAGAEYKVEGDHAFTAEWEENKFTVKFDVNGHGTAPASQIVKEGMKAIKPNDPTESGYTFGGWYKEKECTNAFDFNTAITEDTTLYAKWTKKDNGGSSSGGSSTPSAATTAVKTGDDTPISTWLLILGASALVIAGILVIRKRRKI